MMCDAAHPVAIATLALVCVGSVPSAQAQDASRWDGEPHGATRLIAGASLKSAGTKLVRAGIEIRLDPGWKT
jgi:DsbC/DsbD-like thiol-disulfide interchange protein